MQISYQGVKLLESLEGLRLVAYRDIAGVWTLGYGTTRVDGKPVEEGMVCTPQQAELYMEKDLAPAQTAVNTLVKCPLKQTQFDALVCFVYNIGVEAFRNSTMLKLLNTYQYSLAADQFPRWSQAGGKVSQGLLNRRMKEQALFKM